MLTDMVSTLLLAIFVKLAIAIYDQTFFATSYINFQCPTMYLKCQPPQVCVHEASLHKYYCCDPGPGTVCWTGTTDCSGGTEVISCPSGNDQYCCLRYSEECTQMLGQINICWARPDRNENPFRGIAPQILNQTFLSLSSASPSATTLALDMAALFPSSSLASTYSSATISLSASIADSASTPNLSSALRTTSLSENANSLFGPSSTTSTSIATQSLASSQTSSPKQPSSPEISRGGIAGIVIGVTFMIGAVAGAIVVWRKRKINAKQYIATHELPGNFHAGAPTQSYSIYAYEMQHPPMELDGRRSVAEIPGTHTRN